MSGSETLIGSEERLCNVQERRGSRRQWTACGRQGCWNNGCFPRVGCWFPFLPLDVTRPRTPLLVPINSLSACGEILCGSRLHLSVVRIPPRMAFHELSLAAFVRTPGHVYCMGWSV